MICCNHDMLQSFVASLFRWTRAQMRAQAARMRRERRMHMNLLRSWHQCADKMRVMTQKGRALESRHDARKAVRALRSWFYRVSCVRGAMSTRKRTMRGLVQRATRGWRRHASTRQAAVVMSKTLEIVEVKNIFGAWHLRMT